jgi:hypothetical protein
MATAEPPCPPLTVVEEDVTTKHQTGLPRVPTSLELEAMLQGEVSPSANEFPVRAEKAQAGGGYPVRDEKAQAGRQRQDSSASQELDDLLQGEDAPTSLAEFPDGTEWKVTAGSLPVSDAKGHADPVEVGGIIEFLDPEALPPDVQSDLARMPGLSRAVRVNGKTSLFLTPEAVNDALHRGHAVLGPCDDELGGGWTRQVSGA